MEPQRALDNSEGSNGRAPFLLLLFWFHLFMSVPDMGYEYDLQIILGAAFWL